jgi:uncharacterized protein (TIGR03437 family)
MPVRVTASPNLGLARVGSVQVGNGSIPVMQASAAGCVVSLPAAPLDVGPLGGTISLPFSMSEPGCQWTVASATGWASLVSSNTGIGSPGTAQFQVEPFSSQSFREATVFVNGVTFLIRQAGFDLSLAPEMRAVVDAAAYRPDRLASGGLAVAFGEQLAGAVLHASSRPLPDSLGNVVLRIRRSDGQELLAPLVYVSPTQINFLIPDDVVGPVEFRVEDGQRLSQWFSAEVQPFYPSLFQVFPSAETPTLPRHFAGYAYLVLPDGSTRITPLRPPNSSFNNGVDRGPEGSELYLVLFGTGFPKDATMDEYRGPSAQPRFTLQFAGPHPDFVGLH